MLHKSITQDVKFVNCEYVRKGTTGLELVQNTDGHETITPVKTTTKGSTRKRLVIGYEPIEPGAVFVNINGDFSRVVEV